MTKKALLLSLSSPLLVLACGTVIALRAQQPPSPALPPQPHLADVDDAGNFSFFFEGGNFLGVSTEQVTKENAGRYGLPREPRGVGITRVVRDSPAERAGLKENDVITRFDGEAVTSVRKLNRLIGEASPEHTARLTIARGGAEQEISVTLGTRRSEMPRMFEGAVRPPLQGELGRGFEVIPRGGDGSFSMSFGTGRRIGVSTTSLTKQLADYFGVAQGGGVLVSSVTENSPAARAGIKAGDVITEADGERVANASDLTRALNRKKEGEVTLTIIRERKQRTIKLTPERREGRSFEFSPDALFIPPVAKAIRTVPLPRIRVTPRANKSLLLRAQPRIL